MIVLNVKIETNPGTAAALKDAVAAMEKAKDVAGEGHPEISFNLGSTYAVMEPPQKEKAVRLLNQFTKGACRGGNAKKFKDQCATASGLIQKLGS